MPFERNPRKRFPARDSHRKTRRWVSPIPALSILIAIPLAFASLAPAASPQGIREDIREKVGVYIWGRVPDLAAAVADAKSLGADQVVRTFLGPWSDNPPYDDDLRSLLDKAASGNYRPMLDGFPVVMLTAYDSVSYPSDFRSRDPEEGSRVGVCERASRLRVCHPSLAISRNLTALTDEEAEKLLAAVRGEFRMFAFELAKRDRTFILSNWEAENDVPDARLWPGYVRYLQPRLDGIREGREIARREGYPAKVFTAFEFTIVPGFAGRPSGLVEIGSKLRGLDYLSYSAWWSVGAEYDARTMQDSFRSAFQSIRGFARRSRLPERLIVGEFGEYWDAHPTAERLRAIVDVSISEGVEYLFNWVLYEQPGERDEQGRDASHFGKFTLDRTLTPQGRAVREWFRETER
jgi:hypothetical protein